METLNYNELLAFYFYKNWPKHYALIVWADPWCSRDIKNLIESKGKDTVEVDYIYYVFNALDEAIDFFNNNFNPDKDQSVVYHNGQIVWGEDNETE